jgi:F-type H+-transporting ATPase subunit b
MLDLNITLLFQLANFFIAIFVLNILLIKPIREIIKKRNGIIADMTSDADGFEKQAATRLADYEAALIHARQDAGAARNSGREAGAVEQQNIVNAAQQKARNVLDEARNGVRAEADDTLKALRKKVDGLSVSLADRLIKD